MLNVNVSSLVASGAAKNPEEAREIIVALKTDEKLADKNLKKVLASGEGTAQRNLKKVLASGEGTAKKNLKKVTDSGLGSAQRNLEKRGKRDYL